MRSGLLDKAIFAENAHLMFRLQFNSVPAAFLLVAKRTGRMSEQINIPPFLTPAPAEFRLCAKPESFRLRDYGDSLGAML
jgi:hypothetical protein